MDRTIADRIQQRIGKLETTARAVSMAATGKPDVVRKLLATEGRLPTGRTLTKLAEALHTTEIWLLHEQGIEDTRQAVESLAPPSTDGARLAPKTMGFSLLSAVPLAELNAMMPLDLPVVGTAAGSAIAARGGFEIEARIIDTVRRPPALVGIAEAYAILVTGRSMEPEHRQGDLRFVNPKLRPMIGDSVVLSTQTAESDPPEGYIGHLIRRSAQKVTLGKLNPESSIDFASEYVLSTHKILSLNDLFIV